jgi:oxygen-independent coproporphyrinogen III oxidase
MVLALAKELQMRKSEFENEVIETIYFGGGTPSILQIADLRFLIEQVYKNYKVAQNPEITIEANPDDLISNVLSSRARHPERSRGARDFYEEYRSFGINRLFKADESGS